MYMQIVSSVYHPEPSPGVQGGQRVHRIATLGLRKRGSRRQTAPAARKQHLCNLINYSSRRNHLYLLFSLTFDIWGHFQPSCLFPSSGRSSVHFCPIELNDVTLKGGGFVFFLKQYFFLFLSPKRVYSNTKEEILQNNFLFVFTPFLRRGQFLLFLSFFILFYFLRGR